jgi:hypothetical protein
VHRHQREAKRAVVVASERRDVDDGIRGERVVQVREAALDADVAELRLVEHEQHEIVPAGVERVGRRQHLVGAREVHEAVALVGDATVGPLVGRGDAEEHAQVIWTAVARSCPQAASIEVPRF